ncbi:hypothetical protein DM02DRAFT_677604 [Periconia macrospinosa]|uniref:Uncharacterized protein n=1 Tax=Periconia macrospinosa TaxID=97972 RepID=A0A2V1D2K1_9PLEO|nr:hypothetical protein DM02DRAFT_677604 [Periconia macrospinosa]
MANLVEGRFDGQMPPTIQTLLENSAAAIWEQASTVPNTHGGRMDFFQTTAPREPSSFCTPGMHHLLLFSKTCRAHPTVSYSLFLSEREFLADAPQSLTSDDKESMMTRYETYAKTYLDLARDEMRLRELAAQQVPESKLAFRSMCCELSTEIFNYVDGLPSASLLQTSLSIQYPQYSTTHFFGGHASSPPDLIAPKTPTFPSNVSLHGTPGFD